MDLAAQPSWNAAAITVVVPIFRSEGMLAELYRRILAVVEPLDPDFELVLVEDCGGDGSWELIHQLSSTDRRVKGIQLSRNFGQHAALLCGIRHSSRDLIVTLDDDLQNPPEEIPKLIAALQDGFDVVYGTPLRQGHGLLRNMASRVTKLALEGAMGADAASKVSAFRAFRRRVADSFADFKGPAVNIDVLLTWGTSKFSSVTVRQDRRAQGESGYTLRKLIAHAMNMMTGFSTLPLQLASVVGFAFSAVGVVLLLFVVARYLVEGSSVPGFPFLASIVTIFSGVQLFALGIFGEYLARMHFRSMERPSYHVNQQAQAELPESMR